MALTILKVAASAYVLGGLVVVLFYFYIRSRSRAFDPFPMNLLTLIARFILWPFILLPAILWFMKDESRPPAYLRRHQEKLVKK